MQTSRASLPRHACFGRWEHKLIGASTHLAYLQGVNYDVHGWVGFVYFILIKLKLNRLLIWLVFLCSVRKNGVFFLNYRKLLKTSLAVLHCLKTSKAWIGKLPAFYSIENYAKPTSPFYIVSTKMELHTACKVSRYCRFYMIGNCRPRACLGVFAVQEQITSHRKPRSVCGACQTLRTDLRIGKQKRDCSILYRTHIILFHRKLRKMSLAV